MNELSKQKPMDLKLVAEGEVYSYTTTEGVSVNVDIGRLKGLVKVQGNQKPPTTGEVILWASELYTNQLNPYTNDCWLVNFKNGWQPVVAEKIRLRRASMRQDYGGFCQGWIDKDGVRHAPGIDATVTQDAIVGMWGKFLRGDRLPLVHETYMNEYNQGMAKMGKKLTHIQKVNRDQGIRLCYPEVCGTLYTNNEMQGQEALPKQTATPEAASRSERRKGIKSVDTEAKKQELMSEFTFKLSSEIIEKDFIFLGLAGMMDPPRSEAEEAVKLCKTAGIRPVMITGDHPVTAQAVAKRLGIIDGADTAITGRELAEIPLDEFEKQVEHLGVYARVAPEQKLRIVTALQDKNHYVAMTGDGVNDAPALKKANIGIAMGITGTDVSKQASDMILLDDNFATIVKAVREGRRIYDNILKFITYSLTSNAGTIWVVFLAPFLGLPLPLLPIQILWMNLLCDSLPGLALTTEPADTTIMRRAPRPYDEGVFSQGRGAFIFKFGLLIGITVLIFQAVALKADMPWQTMLFSALVFGRLAIAMAVRSEHDSLFQLGFLSNKPLVGAIFITFVLQLAVVYFPALNQVFKTEPLSLSELAITLFLAAVVLPAAELEKLYRRNTGVKTGTKNCQYES